MGIDSIEARRARTRSMIALGGLLKKSGLLETFQIELGLDLQKDITMREPVAALFKGFLTLNEMISSEEVSLKIWAVQGLELLAQSKTR